MRLTIKQAFNLGAVALLVLGSLTTVAAWMSARSGQLADATADRRYQSFLLADELRQSSDDLTRLARTYVVTGDPKWEQQYNEILDIRNGKRPRPQAYERIYWDFRAAGQDTVRPPGQAVALLDLMKQAGFADNELAKLTQAQANGYMATMNSRSMSKSTPCFVRALSSPSPLSIATNSSLAWLRDRLNSSATCSYSFPFTQSSARASSPVRLAMMRQCAEFMSASTM
jgi:methyl-accepting chemotaxis protein